jgi:hypothetical protein
MTTSNRHNNVLYRYAIPWEIVPKAIHRKCAALIGSDLPLVRSLVPEPSSSAPLGILIATPLFATGVMCAGE